MTCCVGIKLDRGLVFAADTRTNAGVDNISTFKKLHVWEERGERVITLLSAGNLAVTHIHFNGWGEKQVNRRDNQIAGRVAERLGLGLIPSGLRGEGGGVDHAGGIGWCRLGATNIGERGAIGGFMPSDPLIEYTHVDRSAS